MWLLYLTFGIVRWRLWILSQAGLIQENAERLGVADRVQTQNWTPEKCMSFSSGLFDKILVDALVLESASCAANQISNTIKETADFTSLQEIQLEILGSVCQTLRKGGITYSTCTIVSEENFQVVKAFLESHPEFEQVKLEHECKISWKMAASWLLLNCMEVMDSLSANFARYQNRRNLTQWK